MYLSVYADGEQIKFWEHIPPEKIQAVVDLFKDNSTEFSGKTFVFKECKLVTGIEGFGMKVALELVVPDQAWTAERIERLAYFDNEEFPEINHYDGSNRIKDKEEAEEAFDKAIADTPIKVAQAWLDNAMAEEGEDQDMDDFLFEETVGWRDMKDYFENKTVVNGERTWTITDKNMRKLLRYVE